VAVITFNGLDLIRIIVDEENKEKTRFSPFPVLFSIHLSPEIFGFFIKSTQKKIFLHSRSVAKKNPPKKIMKCTTFRFQQHKNAIKK
jgi:hypothetical protein